MKGKNDDEEEEEEEDDDDDDVIEPERPIFNDPRKARAANVGFSNTLYAWFGLHKAGECWTVREDEGNDEREVD